jgi:hypothetical protein
VADDEGSLPQSWFSLSRALPTALACSLGTQRAKASSPFHKRYSRAKFAVSTATHLVAAKLIRLGFVTADAYFLQLSKIVPDSNFLSGSPLPAERCAGLESAPRIKLETK